jgi:hypothetical protein
MTPAKTNSPARAHIVALREAGEIEASQLRVGGDGAGQTAYCSASMLGSECKAIAVRTSGGAPLPSRKALLADLRATHARGVGGAFD